MNKPRLDAKHVRRILILYWGRLGDNLAVTPLIEALKKKFSQAEIFYIVDTSPFLGVYDTGGRILENNPYVKKWIECDISFVRTLVGLPAFDIVIDLCANRHSKLLSYLSGASIRVWGDFRSIFKSFFWAKRLDNGQWGQPQKVPIKRWLCRVDLFLEIARLFGISPSCDTLPKIYLSSSEKIFAKNFFKKMAKGKKMLIGIHPGTSSRRVRSWSERSYAYVADYLTEELDAEVVVFHGPLEADRAKRICGYSKYPLKKIHQKSLRKLFAMMSACQLFMTSDGGPLHMALAVGTPCIGLFVPAGISRYWYAPYKQKGHLYPVFVKDKHFRKKEIMKVIAKAKEILI